MLNVNSELGKIMNAVCWNVFHANSDRLPICLQNFVRRKQTVELKTHKRTHVRVKGFRICHVWKMRTEHLQPRYGSNISSFEKTEHVSRSNEIFWLLQRYDLFFFNPMRQIALESSYSLQVNMSSIEQKDHRGFVSILHLSSFPISFLLETYCNGV